MTKPDVQVAVDELRVASNNIDQSVGNVDLVKQNISTATLTRDDFGSLNVATDLYNAYAQVQPEHLTNIEKAKNVFSAAATALRGVAENYAKADHKSTVSTH